jgi:PLP dependent protein
MKMNFDSSSIFESVKRITDTIPSDVILLAAAKTRLLEEVEAVIQAGVTHIGYNYVQEAIPIIQSIGMKAKWHMIGHLQRNKAKTASVIFDMIETVDSWRLAEILNQRCKDIQKNMPVLIEINSGMEANKTGILPDKVEDLVRRIEVLENLRVQGVMTMGPRFGDPEKSRPYFNRTRKIFDRLASMNQPYIQMKYLSMGMSNSYTIAIEEGANLVRIGSKIFGSSE